MKRLESIEDQMRGIVTYELPDGRRVQMDAGAVRDRGAAAVLRSAGLGRDLPTERLPVMLHGHKFGTLPADFDPHNVKSTSYWYDPRPSDFKRDGDVWVAAKNLGPGDVKAVQGFQRIEPS